VLLLHKPTTTNHTSRSISLNRPSYLIFSYLVLYRYWIDGSEMQKLGWKPEVSFEEGLAKTSTPTSSHLPPTRPSGHSLLTGEWVLFSSAVEWYQHPDHWNNWIASVDSALVAHPRVGS
jgi:hypothetical protein